MKKRRHTFRRLLEQHVGIAYDRQLHLDAQTRDWDWELDEDAGAISFSKGWGPFKKRRACPVQILGSESYALGTWMWEWANVGQATLESLTEAARALKALGKSAASSSSPRGSSI